MKRSAYDIFTVALALAAAAPLVSRLLAEAKVGAAAQAEARAGAQASSPLSFNWAQWKALTASIWEAIGADRLSLLAAGVAFYALFAVFPALGAATWLFGLLADPGAIQQQLASLREVVPAEAYKLIQQQLAALTSHRSAGVSIAGLISLIVALFSARLAAASMIDALNAVYKVEEMRGFIKTNAIAILFTAVAIAVFLLAIALLLLAPGAFPFCRLPSAV